MLSTFLYVVKYKNIKEKFPRKTETKKHGDSVGGKSLSLDATFSTYHFTKHTLLELYKPISQSFSVPGEHRYMLGFAVSS